MELGTTLLHEKFLDIPASAARAARAGFRYIDFDLTGDSGFSGGDEETYFVELRRAVEREGVMVSQAHAPYLKKVSTDPSEFFGEDFLRRQRAAVRRAAYLGAPYLVYHPYVPYGTDHLTAPYDYERFREQNFARNLEFFGMLKPLLKEYGVRAAIENTVAFDWVRRGCAATVCCTSEETRKMIRELGEETFCACLDVGHLNLLKGESPAAYIQNLGGHLKVLHLHDNFGAQNDWFGELDRHLPPFYGCVDWLGTVRALRAFEFAGVFSFECTHYGPPEFADGLMEYLFRAGTWMLEQEK